MSARKGPPLRVEVVPVGFYTDRVTDPVKEHGADRVYIIRAREDREDIAAKFRSDAILTLKRWKADLDIRVVTADLWDLESAVETFAAIIRREVDEGNAVWVNLSTGTKVEALAAALACTAHGGTPYYVRMKSYEGLPAAEPLAEGVASIDVVPMFGLAAPTPGGLAALELLAQNAAGVSKKGLIAGLTELGLIPGDSWGKSPQARYARLQAILDRLAENPPLVHIEGNRRAGRIKITERGRLALRIFAPRPGLSVPQ